MLELAGTGADLKAVAGIHPSLHAITPADTPRIKGEVLVHVGGDDPFAPPGQRTAFEADMSDGGVRWQMHVYGGVRHSFTNATLEGREIPGLAYDRFAAEHHPPERPGPPLSRASGICPVADSRTARSWPTELPGGGQVFCPWVSWSVASPPCRRWLG